MPYFVYKISSPFKQLEKINVFPTFKEAGAFAKLARVDISETDKFIVKVVFADNELHAEDLLNQVRDPEPLVGDDY